MLSRRDRGARGPGLVLPARHFEPLHRHHVAIRHHQQAGRRVVGEASLARAFHEQLPGGGAAAAAVDAAAAKAEAMGENPMRRMDQSTVSGIPTSSR